jgi:PAS domain S-box-containing protein
VWLLYDVTERQHMEEALRNSEERLHRIVKATNDAVWEWDLVTNTLWWSEGVEILFGYVPETATPDFTWWEEQLHPEDRERVMATFHTKLASKTHVWSDEYRFRRADGAYAQVFNRGYIDFDDNGTPLRAFGGIMDITARKHAEEALRQSEARFQRIATNFPGGMIFQFLLHPDGSIAFPYVSPNARELYEVEPAEIQRNATLVFALVHPEDRAALDQSIARSAQTLAPWRWEFRLITPSGTLKWFQGASRPERQANGDILWDGLMMDVTTRKQAEDALQQAKDAAEAANRAKSEFLATMSHELRTPLGIILGYTELLLEDTFGPLKEGQADSLRRIDRSARELHDLITAVLDLSRLEAGRLPLGLCETQVGAVLQQVQAETRRLQEQTPLKFVWEIEEALPVLYTDPGKLKIVLKNLLGNAVKFTPGGSITVAVRRAEEGVEFCVIDTGIGIPQEALGVIFEPFRQLAYPATRQNGGTGLGLHIVKRLLEVLGGTITVESEVGQGSLFRVWLPQGKSGEQDFYRE